MKDFSASIGKDFLQKREEFQAKKKESEKCIASSFTKHQPHLPSEIFTLIGAYSGYGFDFKVDDPEIKIELLINEKERLRQELKFQREMQISPMDEMDLSL